MAAPLKRIVVCATGNSSRGDEGAAVAALRILRNMTKENVILIDCGSSPQGYVNRVRDAHPTSFVMISAVDMGRMPGTVARLDAAAAKRAMDERHMVKPAMLLGYAQGLTDDITVVAIQPKTSAPGRVLSAECRKAAAEAADEVAKIINESLRGC